MKKISLITLLPIAAMPVVATSCGGDKPVTDEVNVTIASSDKTKYAYLTNHTLKAIKGQPYEATVNFPSNAIFTTYAINIQMGETILVEGIDYTFDYLTQRLAIKQGVIADDLNITVEPARYADVDKWANGNDTPEEIRGSWLRSNEIVYSTESRFSLDDKFAFLVDYSKWDYESNPSPTYSFYFEPLEHGSVSLPKYEECDIYLYKNGETIKLKEYDRTLEPTVNDDYYVEDIYQTTQCVKFNPNSTRVLSIDEDTKLLFVVNWVKTLIVLNIHHYFIAA